eukprot:m.93132 g.93132  ORF g.93132 m.93132 type:complete len:355 (+) comp14974_c0_seq1:298-1362(+)
MVARKYKLCFGLLAAGIVLSVLLDTRPVLSPVLSKVVLTRFDIDVVITWVDPSDATWRQQFAASAREAGIKVDTARIPAQRDHDELYYNFLGLIVNTPWVRQVFLVTQRPQQPPYLDSLRKVAPFPIHVVHHDEIMPHEYLPTFQSNSIEYFLDKIPGLAERFIYLNDDILILRPLGASAFFTWSGKAIAPVSKPNPELATTRCREGNVFQCGIEYTQKLLGQDMYPRWHGAHTMTKSVLVAIREAFGPEEVAKAAGSRHRRPDIGIPIYAATSLGHPSMKLWNGRRPFRFKFVKALTMNSTINFRCRDVICLNGVNPDTPEVLQEKVFAELDDIFLNNKNVPVALLEYFPWKL